MSSFERAVEMAQEGKGRVVIARETGLTEHEIKKAIALVRQDREPLEVAPEPSMRETLIPVAPHTPRYYDRASDALFAVIGRRAAAFPVRPEPGPVPPKEHIAVFSDLHIPFHDLEALVQAVDEALAEGCRRLVIGGDGFDFHRMSRYVKEHKLTFEDEIAKSRVVLEWLASQFEAVEVEGGNHDTGRGARWVAENISEEFHFLVNDPMDLLLADLPNVKMVGHRTPFGADMAWLYQLGKDCIITHCELSSAQQGVNLGRLKDWTREWGKVIGLNPDPRCFTTGHTHRLTEHHDYDALLIETGTLASWGAQLYQLGAQLKNRKPGVQGWVLIVQEDGVTDLKASGVRRLRGLPPAAPALAA